MQLREFLILANDPFSSSLRTAAEIVDSLHAFPTMPQIPLVVTKSRREQGSYHYGMKPHRPIRIEISRFATCPTWTLFHEIGHMLDHLVLNPIKRGFGSDHDPIFDELSEAWRRSRLVQSLLRLLIARSRFVDAASRGILRGYLTPRELWARSYVQWVAVQSQDYALLGHLDRLRIEGDLFGGIRCAIQWDDRDFDDIMLAVIELFKNARLA